MPLDTIVAILGFAEPFSSISHLLAAPLTLIIGIIMLKNGHGKTSNVVSLAIYIFSYLFLLSMSGIFHSLSEADPERLIFQRLDHAGIFFLIAGTFTPVHTILFKGFWRWGMLLLIWSIAITSMILKVIYFDSIGNGVGLAMFLGAGWVGAISGILLYRRYGFNFMKSLLYGAFAYTIGAVLEFLNWPNLYPGYIGPHEIFHIMVLLGVGYHMWFVYSFAHHDQENGLPVKIRS